MGCVPWTAGRQPTSYKIFPTPKSRYYPPAMVLFRFGYFWTDSPHYLYKVPANLTTIISPLSIQTSIPTSAAPPPYTMTSQIRFLVISDTHSAWPYTFANPSPPADVLLHCGDLTQFGGLTAYRKAMEDIKTVSAELKFIIAGNHDLDIDEDWVRANAQEEDDIEDCKRCVEFLNAQREFGIHYLTEGLHSFILRDGRTFTVYTSPYTSEFNRYAFAYGKDDMRFLNIPAGVDILMTHGPPLFPSQPKYTLDVNKDAFHCGCEKLAAAVQWRRPRLHAFGHIHEERGAVRIGWECEEVSAMEVARNDQEALKAGWGGGV
jgi:Icc-related predicted phosphoesterase